MTDTSIKFDKKLTDYELSYWRRFLNELPTPSNNYISNAYEIWDGTHPFKDLRKNKFLEHIQLSKKCNNKEELINELSKDVDIISINNAYKKAINTYDELFPNLTPQELMFITIYFSSVKDINISINNEGISLLNPNNKESIEIPYAPQLSLLADLMNGRIKEIDKGYKGRNIEIYGSQQIGNDNKVHHITVSYGKKAEINNEFTPTVFVEKSVNYLTEFAIDFSGENYDNDIILSPLGEFQKDIIKVLRNIKLECELTNQSAVNKRMKI